ncbi:MAG: DUF86 domain-containing protein [Saprospiraceae bacterium]
MKSESITPEQRAYLFLSDILDACTAVRQKLDGKTRNDFDLDQTLYESPLWRIFTIGEAVKNIPETLKSQKPEVPWRNIARARDLLAHRYFRTNPNIIWEIVSHNPYPPLSLPCKNS